MVIFDSTFLTYIAVPGAAPPMDPETGLSVADGARRIEHLVISLGQKRALILVPTPVLAEVLVYAGKGSSEFIDFLSKSKNFKIVPFDTRAAIEAAEIHKDAISQGGKKGGSSRGWQTIKVDRQIFAIAKILGVDVIYSNDKDFQDFGQKAKIKVISVAELDEPPKIMGSLDMEHT